MILTHQKPKKIAFSTYTHPAFSIQYPVSSIEDVLHQNSNIFFNLNGKSELII